MSWDPNAPLKFHVLRKSTGNLHPIQYESDPMGFFHIINAYEEGGNIILDAPFNSNPINYDSLKISNIGGSLETIQENMTRLGPAAGPCLRFVLPLSAPKFTGKGSLFLKRFI